MAVFQPVIRNWPNLHSFQPPAEKLHSFGLDFAVCGLDFGCLATAWRPYPLRHPRMTSGKSGRTVRPMRPIASMTAYRLARATTRVVAAPIARHKPNQKSRCALFRFHQGWLRSIMIECAFGCDWLGRQPAASPAVSAGLHFSPTINMQGATIGSFSINIASGANAPTVQYSGRWEVGAVKFVPPSGCIASPRGCVQ
jgi:hypothetical protein